MAWPVVSAGIWSVVRAATWSVESAAISALVSAFTCAVLRAAMPALASARGPKSNESLLAKKAARSALTALLRDMPRSA